MPDFDEGKRSCRRKLERHNRRRRRRPTDLASVEEKEKGPQADLLTEATYDEEPKEGIPALFRAFASKLHFNVEKQLDDDVDETSSNLFSPRVCICSAFELFLC